MPCRPGADVAGVSPVPEQMWAPCVTRPKCRAVPRYSCHWARVHAGLAASSAARDACSIRTRSMRTRMRLLHRSRASAQVRGSGTMEALQHAGLGCTTSYCVARNNVAGPAASVSTVPTGETGNGTTQSTPSRAAPCSSLGMYPARYSAATRTGARCQSRRSLQHAVWCCHRLSVVALTLSFVATGCPWLQQVVLGCNRLSLVATGCLWLQHVLRAQMSAAKAAGRVRRRARPCGMS